MRSILYTFSIHVSLCSLFVHAFVPSIAYASKTVPPRPIIPPKQFVASVPPQPIIPPKPFVASVPSQPIIPPKPFVANVPPNPAITSMRPAVNIPPRPTVSPLDPKVKESILKVGKITGQCDLSSESFPKNLARYGNWGGPDWTGGQNGTWNSIDRSKAKPPADDQDQCYMHHDICYGNTRDRTICKSNARAAAFKTCDRVLARCLDDYIQRHSCKAQIIAASTMTPLPITQLSIKLAKRCYAARGAQLYFNNSEPAAD